jgi:uncharacterized protein (TIGR02302 family)
MAHGRQDQPGGTQGGSAMLAAKLAASRRMLLAERIMRALLPVLLVVLTFLGASWLGLWALLPPAGRMAGVFAFALAAALALKPLLTLRQPTDAEASARLDRDSGVAHRPAETALDSLAGEKDSTAQAIWALHQARMRERIAALKVNPPRPDLPARDPVALRFAALALVLVAAFVAGGERWNRVETAFLWSDPVTPPAPPRLDAWIDPPAYTGRAPVFLARTGMPVAGQREVSVPVGSTLVLRASPATDIAIKAGAGLEPVADAAVAVKPTPVATTTAPGALEKRFVLKGEAELAVTRGSDNVLATRLLPIPDNAPTAALVEARPTEQGDNLKLVFRALDDYGIAEASLRMRPARPEGEAPRRTLVEAPTAALSVAEGGRAEVDSEATLSFAEHPWAGARVKVSVALRDDAGQTAVSDERETILPQKLFTNPLAKALVEQRRNIILDPDRKERVQISLDALLIEPERFTKPPVYLPIKLASDRLRVAKTDAQLLAVAEWLWTIALDLEDGNLSDAERALREAQERLKQALERGAEDREIRKLTEELRRAMNNYLRELAQRAERNQQAESQPRDGERTMTQRDLQQMLDRIEQLSREGKHAEAQELLEQLNRMMQNLQAMRQRGEQGERQQGMNQALDELGKLTEEQQRLRDETFQNGQQRRGQQGQRQQQGQRGQQGERGQQGQQGQRGQRGQQGEQGEGEQGEMGEGGEGQQGEGQGQSLQERQGRLRERLRQLQRKLEELGMQGEDGLGDAEQAMRDAEGQLGRGQEGQATDSQGRALDGLRRGMQGMAQQMQQEGEGDGTEQAGDPNGQRDPTGQPRPGQANNNADPLGRPTTSRDILDGRTRVPGAGESAADRARRVLEELRRRLGESERPRGELEYFERLLPRN